jgi:protein CWC15
MTTAHRTTFRNTLASKEESSSLYVVPTRQFAARDCPSHKVMKDRKTYQKDFHKISKKGQLRRQQNEIFRKIVKQKHDLEQDQTSPKNKFFEPKKQDILGSNYDGPLQGNDSESSDEDADDADFTEARNDSKNEKNLKKVEEFSSEDSDDDSDNSDDEDDEEAILLEYERVKKEREEKERQEIKERVEEEGETGQGYSLQKKWFQESVFQNQALKETKEKAEFCNDTVRSKFHKKVLHKFVWT